MIFFFPRFYKKLNLTKIIFQFQKNFNYFIILFIIGFIQLLEVNVVDPLTTNFINYDFAVFFVQIEDSLVANLNNYWHPAVLVFGVLIYIIIYPFTLWFSPLYFTFQKNNNAMKSLVFGLLIILCLAFPFYLFFPVTNVYTYFSIPSALNAIIPSIEEFFYRTTTSNNCFPSLHTAITILIFYCSFHVSDKKYLIFTCITMIGVLLSVLYLVIHWLIDVLGGILVATTAICIIHYRLLEKR